MKFETLSVEKQSEGWYKYYRDRDDSIMTDLFEGQLMNRLKCLSCRFETLAFDNFMDLSVKSPGRQLGFWAILKLVIVLRSLWRLRR